MSKFLNYYTDKTSTPQREYFPDEVLVAASGKQYKLGPHFGKGSNGTVFECTSPEGERLAVKFLHMLDGRRIERFDFECQVLGGLDHMNILKVIDIGEIATKPAAGEGISIPFMVTHLFEGNFQAEVTERQPLNAKLLKTCMVQVTSGLAYVHKQGVIHRDLKPGNLFYSGERVVVGDFGLAKTHTDEGQLRFYREDITVSSERIGPAEYMSPELVKYAGNKAHPVDERSDIFQLGAVMFFLLTGEPPRGPFDVEDDPTGGQFAAIIEKCRQGKIQKRYQSMDELRVAIESVEC